MLLTSYWMQLLNDVSPLDGCCGGSASCRLCLAGLLQPHSQLTLLALGHCQPRVSLACRRAELWDVVETLDWSGTALWIASTATVCAMLECLAGARRLGSNEVSALAFPGCGDTVTACFLLQLSSYRLSWTTFWTTFCTRSEGLLAVSPVLRQLVSWSFHLKDGGC